MFVQSTFKVCVAMEKLTGGKSGDLTPLDN